MSTHDEGPPPPEDAKTLFVPHTGSTPRSGDAVQLPTAFSTSPPAVTATPGAVDPSQPAAAPRRIQVGDVLNHIFEVRRFIARGGMGEVFEGVNVNSDERVAIKGILPHLAADPAIQEMFRKEARTLTRLNHPALMQYRVLAQEPAIGAFYIVTEFIEGNNLSDLLRDLNATPADLVMLTRRLAEGLAEAHRLGAIHRDISPDNVMLESGKLDHAKIIDFGIAKDIAPGSATIVGDGFAGKLNYVAPEQLGDFNREVGPWTDVYSLGLTILAVARHRDVDMGGSFVDAIDKRRNGPDLTAAPEQLRPVLAAMLEPDPVRRVRSMGEIAQRLATLGTATPAWAAPRVSPQPVRPAAQKTAAPKAAAIGRRVLFASAGGVGIVLALLIGWHLMATNKQPSGALPPATVTPAAVSPVTAAREAVLGGLDTVPCSWLDLVSADAGNGGVALSFRGVAGSPADAQAAISRLVRARGVQAGSIDFGEVMPIPTGSCAPLEAFSQIRTRGIPHMSAAVTKFTMKTLDNTAGGDAGKQGAQPITDFDLDGVSGDLSIIGLAPDGALTELTKTRAVAIANMPKANGSYRLTFDITHPGLSGLVLLSGNGPFDPALLNHPNGPPSADWPQRFLQVAYSQGWQAEMIWFQTTADK